MIAQILAVIIFLAMFILIITEVWERHIVTLGCALLTLVVIFGICMHSPSAIIDTLNLKTFFTEAFWHTTGQASESSGGINWETIVFIAGMMIMVEGMAKSGFFRWLCMKIAKMVKYQIIPIFITFMVLSFVLAMFIDSITVILFLAAVTVELSQLLKFNPVPMILSEIFCANLGGSATMCGDPPNIIIGTSLGMSFSDFVTNTGLIAIVCLVAVVIYFYLVFRKELTSNAVTKNPADYPDPSEAITSKGGFVISWIIFLCAVVLLVTHSQTGLTVSCIGVFIALVTLLTAGRDALDLLKKVDYKTLLFFVGLFVVVGGLEKTGILTLLAGFIGTVSGGNLKVMIAIIIWVSAIASAFIDNIPFAATMIPVINSLAATQGIEISILAWALAMGTDIGGSATPIGASANVVGIATAAKSGHMIKWGRYCKSMAPATILVILISMVMIYVRYLP
ncbi:sodium:proton antiporter [Blautia glucerasea]|uniref:SLC13 family permease n=1 Tax=Blautia glucerasea TaxID=536633 RepID=UPI00156D7F20|nr:sodium:proton antiporter [Blautia glucerasea]NSJ26484.1 citrate transporter [Blautia glucerasea]